MKFTVNTQELNTALSMVTKALSTKTTMSILEGVYIAAEKGELLFRCTDLSLQIEATIGAAIDTEGACVLPGRLFTDIARKLPGEETAFSLENYTMRLESGRAVTTMQVEAAKDYVSMPEIHKTFSIFISPKILKEMIRQTTFSTAQDDSKPILRGVLFEIYGNTISLVALDGYRLAMRTEQLRANNVDKNVVVPVRGLLEISRMLDDSDDPIEIVFSQTHMMLDMGHTRIMTRLMDGEFIRYKQILPSVHTVRATVNRQELLDSIERVGLMARESKKKHIRFSLSGDTIVITANSEIGSSREPIYANITGDDLDIAFNSKYFVDVLKVLDNEYVVLEMNSNISPCAIIPEIGANFYYLILPVRMFSGI